MYVAKDHTTGDTYMIRCGLLKFFTNSKKIFQKKSKKDALE